MLRFQMKVGSILECSWGYEQTNVDFYQVIKRTPKFVTVRQLKTVKCSDGPQTMTGTIVPVPGAFEDDSKPMRRKVFERERNRMVDGELREWSTEAISPEYYSFADIWDGRPVRWSSYA